MIKVFFGKIILLFCLIISSGCSAEVNILPKIVISDSQGKTIVNNSGTIDFGICPAGKYVVKSFSIRNEGDKYLKLTESPFVKITGDDANQFVVVKQPEETVEVGLFTTFKIQFEPKITKQCNAIVSISSNDKENSPYTFKITGKGTEAYFDFNGDGYHDIIVGAYRDDDGGNSSGCAFIFLGSATLPGSSDASNADVKFVGFHEGYGFGISVSNAGDLNNDGYDDVIIGSYYDAFIFYGSATPTSVVNASNADVRLIGEDKFDGFGYSVSGAGDMNDDGFDDVIVGAPSDHEGAYCAGSTFVFFGSSNLPSTIYAADADIRIVGEEICEGLGCSVSYAGDVNGDGFDDVIVGTYWVSSSGYVSGCAYIIYGNSNLPTRIDSSNADVIIVGEHSGDMLGWNVGHAGDVNGDGFDDVLVGTKFNGDDDNYSGCAYIFYGSSTLSSIIDASNANVKLISEVEDDYYAWSVSNAGDVNDDGYDDIIIGATGDDDGNTNSGSVYVFLGSTNLPASIDTSSAYIKIFGESFGGDFGYSVGCAGDVNKDGFCDFIVGTPDDGDGGFLAGAAFICFGKKFWTSPFPASSAEVKLIGDDVNDQFGNSVSRR